MQPFQSSIPLTVPWWQTAQRFWLSWLTIGSTIGLGLLRLPEPFWGDQALFVVGGQAIHDGALLYRDFWDLKPPGIYGLYALAGTLFGFDSVGIHWVDLLWMLTLAIVLWVTLKSRFTRSSVATLLPWLCVGTYFAVIDWRQQMQVESLVGLPLYLMVWFNVQAAQSSATNRWRWLLRSGIAAGVVLLFKLIYLPLLVALWSVYCGHRVFQQRSPLLPTLWQTSWPLIIGMALPIVPVIGYWWATGTLDLAFYTQILHPPKMLQVLPHKPLGHLVQAFGWALGQFWPIGLLAAYAIRRNGPRLSLLTTQLIVWLGLGLAMIAAQSQSWWTYHFLLLLVPTSILAADGLDALLAVRRRRWMARALVGLTLGALVLLNLMAAVDMTNLMQRSGLPLSPPNQLAYHSLKAPFHSQMAREVAFLQRPEALPGKIYVIGDPTLYLLSGRAQAVALNGWIPEIFLPEQWQ
jgi:hypothetical protein